MRCRGYALSKLEELNGLEASLMRLPCWPERLAQLRRSAAQEHLDELEVQAKRRPPYDNVDRYWEG